MKCYFRWGNLLYAWNTGIHITHPYGCAYSYMGNEHGSQMAFMRLILLS